MTMNRRTPSLVLWTAMSLWLAGCATGHHNPVDATSNPDKLSYQDVEARRPDFKEPFLRDGVVSEPARFAALTAGTPAARVQELLGQPLQKSAGPRGPEWDYHFKFRMPQSQNYLVCQYKVVFDGAGQAVRETVWRRQQCLDLVGAGRRAG
ncbi:outer membrane protein assembly factor BamE [Xenophilus sp. Marseille-Q4582]|uniref:outer membrane protein assembly factor BamE domain-containing protein n=1 Tax=Xenophilus sp. Marseille-Q4582 TaxID=2866600 RepID=UPI001CE42238|nr:outer membrane protein assembly factor BamE [Xenophilus sp. Marseille-Q4582]